MNEIENALQDCLNRIRREGKTLEAVLALYPQYRNELKPLLETALWLEESRKALSLSDEQFTSSRARLLQQIRQERPPRSVSSQAQKSLTLRPLPLLRLSYLRTIALVVCLLLSLLGGGIALAAKNSLPGESFYPLKLSIEEAQAALVSGPVQQSQLRMNFAERRLAEAIELSRIGNYNAIPTVMAQYQSQILLAQRAMEESAQISPEGTVQTAEEMQQKLNKNIEVLTGLINQLPPQAAVAVQAAIEASNAAIVHDRQMPQTATPAAQFTPTPTPNTIESNQQNKLPTATPSFVPPGQLSKTAGAFNPTFTNTLQPTLEPSKTPKPSRTVKPANTHKPPTKPPPVKPTKKPKP